MELRRSSGAVASVTALFVIAIAVPYSAFAANPLGVPATEADIPLMRYAGYKDPKVGQLWNPSDPNIGKDAGEVKQWLAKHAAKNVQVACFEPEFAKKLKAFMEAAPGGPPIITDGYRSPQAQARLPRGSTKVGPCGSYHQYGLAADFNSKANLQWMHANSRNFGLRPITGPGGWDPGHFQDMRGIFGQCGACSGGPGGELTNVPSGSGGGPQSLGQSLRQALGLEQPQQQPQQQMPQQQLQQSQQPLNYFQGAQSVPANDTAGTTLLPGEIGTTSKTKVGTGSSFDDFLDDETSGQKGSSIADKLLELAYGTSTIGSASDIATSVPIFIDGKDKGSIMSGTQKTSSSSLQASTSWAYHPTQTFISSDLSFPSLGTSETRQDVLFYLADMKERLLWALEMLRPFSLRASLQGEGGDFYAE
ncbi:hypothetical protein HY969_03560 [Candidatus Kaiserbacteria bacterium]|nr:hypothetical protein [Candidatus Kaiserbacteria bacterium]